MTRSSFAQFIVDVARDPQSRLHPYFEWDDAKASQQYRLALRMRARVFSINGTAPLIVHRFSNAGAAPDEATAYRESQYRSAEGWLGIPVAAFQFAAREVCRELGHTQPLSLLIEADGRDVRDATPLVRIDGEPVMDIRRGFGKYRGHGVLTRFCKWTAKLHVQWDADQFTEEDVANLIARAGQLAGVGYGSHGRYSSGLGFGRFVIIDSE